MTSKKDRGHSKVDARRKFLKNAGKFAVATPAAVTTLLGSAKGHYALAISGNRQGNNGFGNGGGDGVPGNSGTNNSPNAGQKKADRVR
jgi:hypothetical protein